jgi:cysteine synthase
MRRLEADFRRSADTHLLKLHLPAFGGVTIYLKDESSHPTGSLKHRLARSLFLYAICNGWLREGSTVVEASSGSTAVSEAYFARLVGLPFVAVMPRSTSAAKVTAIEFHGGRCHFIDDPRTIYAESERLAAQCGGHFMDQFTYAERATDWRANNNIAESIFEQMRDEPAPVPTWLVASAGTGGTLATLGRYVRYGGHATQVCGADAERSVLFAHYLSRDPTLVLDTGSRIEGIGRPRVEPSFIPDTIDAMVKVPDRLSLGAALALSDHLGRRVGGSTGTNLVAALLCAGDLKRHGQRGSVVTLLCDDGARYADTCFNASWREANGLACEAQREAVATWLARGEPVAGVCEGVAKAGSLGAAVA